MELFKSGRSLQLSSKKREFAFERNLIISKHE